jgi:hypothetical protein
MPSPQEALKQFQKDLANETQLLANLDQETRATRARHDKALGNFQQSQKLIEASQGSVDSTRDEYVNAVEAHGVQMGKVNKLKGQIAAAGGQITHGNIPQPSTQKIVTDEDLRKAEEAQLAAEAKIHQPAA